MTRRSLELADLVKHFAERLQNLSVVSFFSRDLNSLDNKRKHPF